MLTVAAARLEEDHASPTLIAALRAAAKHEAGRIAEGRAWSAEEAARVAAQRALWPKFMTARSPLGQLKAAMQQRAYDLMWNGDGLACDALAEFLPESDAEEMFAAWENDWLGNAPRSRFYGGRNA